MNCVQSKSAELAERGEQMEQINRDFEQYKLRAQSVLKQVGVISSASYSKLDRSYRRVGGKFLW
jgi:hypothetical protein